MDHQTELTPLVVEHPGGGDPARSDLGFHHRDAIRLLFILVLGAETEDEQDVPTFRGEKRAMAIDFLVRYPDYLADELLDRFESEGDVGDLRFANAIFAADEPDIRTVAMVRWRRGAFQNIETSLSILTAFGLVRPLVRTVGQRRHDFVIAPQAFDFIERAEREQPSLLWYRERVSLVMTLAGYRSGSSLKDDQYLQAEYRDTPHGSEIPSIKDRVLARLQSLKAGQ